MPQHAWQDAGGVVPPVSAHSCARHALHGLRHLPEHGEGPWVHTLLTEHIQALKIQQLFLALIEDFEELLATNTGVRRIELIVVLTSMLCILVYPITLGASLRFHDRFVHTVLTFRECYEFAHSWMIVVQQEVVKMQCTRFFQPLQNLYKLSSDLIGGISRSGHDFFRSQLRIEGHLVDTHCPHPDAVADLWKVEVARVQEVVPGSITASLQALDYQIHLPEAVGIGLCYCPHVLQQHDPWMVAVNIVERTT
mmetsp:Transcript_127383/g.220834  ORF Transcript_127383/g.220834 Transcript_127383/m.220834 type:complete len:252 (+) Transcript_127383:394-1149(+)